MKHSEEHYKLYFGKKADYYLDVVKDFESGKKVVFNIFSFFFGLFWMLYRKLYIPILVVAILLFVEVIIEQLILTAMNASSGTETLVDRLSMIAWGTLLGLFGNRIYIGQANRKITKIKSLNLSEEETNKKIEISGGTTLLPHLIIVVLIIILIILGQQGYFE
ncbi:DUF2628 domain-containing protein [Marinoscillum furvescens]|uniref:Uncharacterized protein DUF2628 n=1 Tax=Marinoscillum furvescens DSM 4134 TaxID=1122208 RepID=A0A3D9L6X0_MARFU|nr:DUF2628 domain-containing protein [Marinoscillum furvescens]REE02099.1 uncharacterized protein DUF2628 [Marinoscillum furvescens DSM 4134]